jgi:hypothetical protein
MGGTAYRAYYELTGVPNVIADGHPRRSTVLTLSHWPDSATPDPLRRDLSAEIALAYLEAPEYWVEAEVVSNNHFDIDGFMAVWALCNPDEARADPGMVAEVARVGDFGWTDDERAARVAFALGTLKTEAASPLGSDVFAGPDPERVANLYRVLLDGFGDLAAGIDEREELWGSQVANLGQTAQAVSDGRISIEEHPDLDLAVVIVDPDVPITDYSYCLQRSGPCHPLPIHQRTDCSRILYSRGNWVGLVYRFESWVKYCSRPIPARVDLTPAAAALRGMEAAGAEWTYAWPNNPNPPVAWLTPSDLAPTTLGLDTILAVVTQALVTGSEPASKASGGAASYSRSFQ